jgi:uncharacterized protein YggE
MSTLTINRGTAAAACVALLGGAFVTGTALSARGATPSTTTATTTQGASVPQAGITVTGTARVAGTPDTLRLDLSITTKADSIAKALADANTRTSKVHAALTRNGVAAKDLQTSNLTISPDYSYPSDGVPRLNGYTVTESVTAAIRDLRKASNAINAVTTAGGNAVQVGGLSLDLEETGKLAAAARDQAVTDARTKAEQYAKAAGRDLGQLVTISESVSTPPPVDFSRAAADSAGTKAIPIAPGTEFVGVTVTVVYAFK